ncbi:hypothetical protein Q4603_19665 [Zobellia galactanivorans]|uniref:Conserved hypothetical periplasmic protein n=1 Tax=Zobellia galactanivorans (strain DSM 12802 / CCUG 47099 / CIP 106680 / NCIMB 13871 / Dsij) TaxID=63186 RepID=G0L2J0_ZOBGA|nr:MULTISPECIES: hypothetical protein [Zobellia]MBU3024567.1 hypothetical protein [Zobellia galactanivorans]MDO6810848.1 hypothetical protein [Zobellia galactanivorans]OWW26127.1 hypothetical protein B4Q04_00130 [Zobellia sp. OII3]CAZ95017.1 Conserved hypothetical periplasmic protein [Zobellia galactanivorans]
MNKKSLKISILLGLIFANGVFAADPVTEKDESIIQSIDYIDEDVDFELGFDTSDYLPEDFNANDIYVDLDAIAYIEEDANDTGDLTKYLPVDFNAYAYPTHVEDFNYIDVNDEISLNFNTKEHLPEGFNPYIKYN